MSSDLYRDLAWLPRPPADFRRQCRELEEMDELDAAMLRRLACTALSEIQLRRLADVVTRRASDLRALGSLTPFTLGVVGNVTLEPLVPALVATALRFGILLECVRADFAQTVQEALSPDSTINRARPDAVLIALDYRGLPLPPGLYPADEAAQIVAGSLGFLDRLRAGFREHGGALSIVQTLAAPPDTLFGSYDRAVPGTLHQLCASFNDRLVERVGPSEDIVFDVAGLAQTVGLANWHAPTQWNIAKLAFDAAYLPLYADHVGRIIGALRGKSRKCLVLDLDNTLWGGVIGDDGLEGIVLGQGNATGEAFLEVQSNALRLRERGIVLAVSSKNDDAIARSPFRDHTEMLLREHHIAVFQANWNDKATNIATIASELSLGIDAMVFLDDNPAERGLVRQALPSVAVPELPNDPALYVRTLNAAGYFESISFSDEDRKRADFYQDNARRVALQANVADVDSYLASLAMEITFSPFDAAGRSRISQLINKSNQFNLTTRRYTELQVAEAAADSRAFTLQVRLADIFGDNGMICVIICREDMPTVWEIDTWLMSCRVLGRRVEQMVLREILEHARAHGIGTIVGRFIPSERNEMVRDHYAKLGFERLGDDAGATTWSLATDVDVPAAPMIVHRIGFELASA